MRWARYLSGEYTDRAGASFNDAAVFAYEDLDGVPDSLLSAAFAPGTEDDAEELRRVSAEAKLHAKFSRVGSVTCL